ncbi:calcium-binding and coiled-coil domain-containing protein 2 isoform X3 [Frankliniella occidentalis]|uniref:Calcium-binding and coiled-coil domain-containing protein 2 isoform X2 n=1 Tax=Frankliniella occidentalis TaxID=133901 RepID=A0A6J1SJJ6_FRAOC|nr:calcium-binding and coiled-coil domain-containing protein 2 isoform X2 [Frankliniella occidentalis]XP_026281444.1 calcium-binding and coiled-coil domain-containing protein 2 isoform X3 [Frankliniella occidentalis]
MFQPSSINMDPDKEDDSSGPSSLSSDQASLCVIPDPDDSSEEDGFIYLDKSSLPASLNASEHDRAIIVFHSIDEEYPAHQDILCQYIRPDGWEESPKDNICLFRVGWVTKTDAVFMVPPGLPSNDPVGRIVISESNLPKDSTNVYQFCYMREYTLLGASTPFQFTFPSHYGDVNERPNAEMSIGKDFSCNVDSMVQQSAVSLEKLDLSLSSKRQDTSLLYQDNSLFGSLSLDSVQKSMSLYLSDCCSEKYEAFTLMECASGNQALECSDTGKDSAKSISDDKDISTDSLVAFSNEKESENDIKLHTLQEEVHQLKQQVEEVCDEKKWFQEQYSSLLETVKKYAEDLATERLAKESLNGRLAELTTVHKMLCSENAQLHNEFKVVKQTYKDQSLKWEDEKKNLEEQLKEEKSMNESKIPSPSNCSKCDKYQKQVEDLSTRVSDYEIMRNCLEVELEEEMKLSKERDLYLAQVEQIKVHSLQMANNWLASTPTSTENGNTLLEMEENVNSTLEALECALKEMDIMRSRKAAINKANRILREDFMQKKAEWEDRLIKQRNESDAQLNDLQMKLDCEKSSKIALLEDMEVLKNHLHQASQKESQQQIISEAIETAKKEIEMLEKQRVELEKECSMLKKKSGNQEVEEINRTLLKNLQEAREEYKKLYTEKILTQEKLSKLKQKIKSKKTSRAQQESTLNAPKADFMDAVSASWRYTIDELM